MSTSKSAFDPSSAESWDLVAPGYAATSQAVLGLFARDALDLACLGPADRVLDVACGPGTLSLQAAREAGWVHAVDVSPGMVAQLRRQAAEAGLSNLTVEVGDGQALSVEDGTFTKAFSMFGLMFFPDRAKGFAGLHRALGPGGRVGVGSWSPLSRSPAFTVLFEVLRGAGLPFPDDGPRPGSLEEPEVFAEELAQAGFVDIEVHRLVHPFPNPSPEAWWEGMSRGFAPLVLLQREVDPATWAGWRERAIALFGARTDVPPEGFTSEALLGTGLRPA